MGKGRQPGCCLCKPEGAVVMGIFDRVYLVVDSCVLFMYVQLLSSFDHSVMHWLNSGLLPLSVSACRRSMDTAHAQLFEL